MYTLTVNLPNLVEGAEVEIDKLGVFQNGGTYEITPEQEHHFVISHGRTLGQAFKDHPNISATDPDEDLSDDDPDLVAVELDALHVADLREMLAQNNLDSKGTKPELIERLQAAGLDATGGDN